MNYPGTPKKIACNSRPSAWEVLRDLLEDREKAFYTPDDVEEIEDPQTLLMMCRMYCRPSKGNIDFEYSRIMRAALVVRLVKL